MRQTFAKTLVAGLCLGAAIAALLVVPDRLRPQRKPSTIDTPSSSSHKPSEGEKSPTVCCDFYNLMRSATVVSFDFAVDADASGQSRFSEIYVVEPDGTRTLFDGSASGRPVWAFSMDDGTPVIKSTDGDTQINLYGIKFDAPGIFWTEAGLRSTRYRNLEGKCRQAYLGSRALASSAGQTQAK